MCVATGSGSAARARRRGLTGPGRKKRYNGPMGVLVRAVVSGFGFSLGAALFKKVSNHLGLDESSKDKNAETDPDVADDGEINDSDEAVES